MKKILAILSLVLILALAACGGDNQDSNNKNDDAKNNDTTSNNEANSDEKELVTLTVGASSTPHAEILEEATPILAEKGIDLKIEEYTDFILPNDDLAKGSLDANYFQHIPYLEQTVIDTGYELTHIGSIHIEPMGAYSKNIKSVDDIADGTEIIFSNSVSDHGRVLGLLQSAGLIKLDDSVEVAAAGIDDVVENPKNLKFSPDYEPAFLPELYNSEADTVVVINTNYAIGAELNPLEDSLFIEGADSSYVNVIAVREEDKDNDALKTLVEVLKSEEIQSFIDEKYQGAVVPVK